MFKQHHVAKWRGSWAIAHNVVKILMDEADTFVIRAVSTPRASHATCYLALAQRVSGQAPTFFCSSILLPHGVSLYLVSLSFSLPPSYLVLSIALLPACSLCPWAGGLEHSLSLPPLQLSPNAKDDECVSCLAHAGHGCVLPVEALGGKNIHASSHACAWPPCVGNSVKVSPGTMGLHT